MDLRLIIVSLLFSTAICYMPDVRVSDEDLKKLVNELRKIDNDKAVNTQIKLNFQSHTSRRNSIDQAPRRLFTYVDPKLMNKDVMVMFKQLLDNYDRWNGVKEKKTVLETQEEEQFLDFIMHTDVMNRLYEFLKAERHEFAMSKSQFKKTLRMLWFTQYPREDGVTDSSGFEHVFVGEMTPDGVIGLHNWIRFFYLEKRGVLDYKGWLAKRGNLLVGAKFGWHEEWKPYGGFLIGTSPEFDFAVYSLCFLTRRGAHKPCTIDIDGCEINIMSEVKHYRGRSYISDVYPLPGKVGRKCRKTTHQRVSRANLVRRFRV